MHKKTSSKPFSCRNFHKLSSFALCTPPHDNARQKYRSAAGVSDYTSQQSDGSGYLFAKGVSKAQFQIASVMICYNDSGLFCMLLCIPPVVSFSQALA